MKSQRWQHRRCNYCDRDAVVQFSRVSSYSKMGHRRHITLYYSSCAEHEGCVNWTSNLALYPDVQLVRAPSALGGAR